MTGSAGALSSDAPSVAPWRGRRPACALGAGEVAGAPTVAALYVHSLESVAVLLVCHTHAHGAQIFSNHIA
jgi:hypothetical protein